MNPPISIVIADIGNSRIKLAQVGMDSTIEQIVTIAAKESFDLCLPEEKLDWYICSVSPSQTQRLIDWITQNRPSDNSHLLQHNSVPLKLNVDAPEQVGMDRLMAATAAYDLGNGKDVVVVDAGTAVTIDAISNGHFLGGTIFPGSQTEFAALRAQTEQLPLIDEHHFPDFVIGKSTSAAIQSGVIHGQVGAIKHIAHLMADQLNEPTIVATGGGLAPLRSELPSEWIYIPNLVLHGIGTTVAKSAEQRVD